MAISSAKALAVFDQAWTALNNIARSRKATSAQKRKARRARQKLTEEFIGQNIAEVGARTKLVRKFVRDMSAAVKDISGNTAVRALDTLTGIVKSTKDLIEDQ